jgi:hypothetical protein
MGPRTPGGGVRFFYNLVMARLLAALVVGLSTAASAAVVEVLSPSIGIAGSPVPALSLTMSGPVTASFVPALTASISGPSFSGTSAILLPAPVAAVAAVQPSVIIPHALAAAPKQAPASAHDARGPPKASDAGFTAFVAKTVAVATRGWAVPSDEILEHHDAILVGENHGSLASVTELARALPRLSKAGVTVLGIEGLKRTNQESVDAYVSGRADVLPFEVLSFSPRRREAFEALLKSARSTGMRVVALGLPLDGWARQTAELAAAKTGDPLESFLRAPGDQLYRAQTGYEPGYNEAVAEVYLTRRNESMASFLVEAMVRGAKAVALVGQNHVESTDAVTLMLTDDPGRWGNMGKELARLGLKAFSLTLTGGRFVDAAGARDDRDARPASYAKAALASPDGAPSFTRTGAHTGLFHAGGTVPAVAVAH